MIIKRLIILSFSLILLSGFVLANIYPQPENNKIISACTYSDGNTNSNIKGFANSTLNGTKINYCDSDNVTLYKAACVGNYSTYYALGCYGGCSNGSCMKENDKVIPDNLIDNILNWFRNLFR